MIGSIRAVAGAGLLLLASGAWAAHDNAASAVQTAGGAPNTPAIEYYDLSGNNLRELRKDLELRRPRDQYGEPYDGYTDWHVSWSYRLSGSGKNCRVESLDTELKVGMKLPRWTPPADASKVLVAAWERYSTALRHHEDGHHALAVEAETELVRRLADRSGSSGCDALARQIDKAADSILGEYEIKQAEYDLVTDHGAKQGVQLSM
ncbi:DUF922 domain-containing protein [Lysobacter niastensis]|uniref:DUF922 domain-containing protein n=1 Tax=Lysobacter niastensis TaxID=380629 RepID=A0ABS0B7Q7_9GAMM|nr:DUF922 domain-containing protein [Lysobacter niastensis]MBF6023727.1 DUF922 domain-containing protein [Lysobacter niastensis]